MYLDPSAGRIGASLDTVYGAATSGALKVDPDTGEATLRFLNHVQDLTERMQRDFWDVSVKTPLGGGFGEVIGNFNERLATGETNSAQDVLNKFRAELQRLKEAVSMSMRSYAAMDADNTRSVATAGSGR